MINNEKNNQNQDRQAYCFKPESEHKKQQTKQPQAKEKLQGRDWQPEIDSTEDQLPQSIESVADIDFNTSNLSSLLTLEKLPIAGLKGFVISLLTIIGVIAGYEVWQIFSAALNTHWSLAAAFSALMMGLTGFSIKAVCSFLSDHDLQIAADLQALALQSQVENETATENSQGRSHAARASLIHRFQSLYAGKPHAELLQKTLDSLPDYADDLETLNHIEQHFLKPLDQQALKLISQHSLTTGTVVALSPWVGLDMLFSLYRNTKMLNQIGQIYGLRPSLANRWRLMKSVINHLALAGASEALLDQLVGEAGIASLASLSASKIMQGLGLGLYTGRIGLAGIKACRPVEFSANQQPKLKMLLKPLLMKLTRR
ncbi:YcjF family protein [Pelagibaculum spongiae]|uniref:TIGR01620 family protein n=1 Tax=Pelagibaculum spongiae TaxID=2080658 RepID=A0A2V1GRK2_9GAMM|nr:YcjF family protein [Pelagibaculum spongiae]PVZ67718.1 hypothetical protein DC094_14890 [Pelagibaculum spongiae]